MSTKKSGYTILKEKVAKLEQERDEWKAKFETLKVEDEHVVKTIADQARCIESLRCSINAADGDRAILVARHEQEKEAMLKYMGWLRRLIWNLRHPIDFSIDLGHWHE